jgi:hypothetical protein
MDERARIVPEGFRYTSDSNNDWLDEVRLKELLLESEMA